MAVVCVVACLISCSQPKKVSINLSLLTQNTQSLPSIFQVRGRGVGCKKLKDVLTALTMSCSDHPHSGLRAFALVSLSSLAFVATRRQHTRAREKSTLLSIHEPFPCIKQTGGDGQTEQFRGRKWKKKKKLQTLNPCPLSLISGELALLRCSHSFLFFSFSITQQERKIYSHVPILTHQPGSVDERCRGANEPGRQAL